jgi:hypothetical protein
MPGSGEEIEGAMQQAAQRGRQASAGGAPIADIGPMNFVSDSPIDHCLAGG